MGQSAYKDVITEIKNSLAAAGREPDSTTLVVVSKTFQAGDIVPVLNQGARIFGENRVQEATGKWPELKNQFSGVELHLIGPLQSNKASEAVRLFDVIHTIDREKIAATISAEMAKQVKKLQLFVQVNTGSEEQKAGILPDKAAEFVALCREKYELEISGLMCIPPFDENPGPHFALLRQLAQKSHCQNLSMGMSGDFNIAIEFGATHIRVGSAIFGARTAPLQL